MTCTITIPVTIQTEDMFGHTVEWHTSWALGDEPPPPPPPSLAPQLTSIWECACPEEGVCTPAHPWRTIRGLAPNPWRPNDGLVACQ